MSKKITYDQAFRDRAVELTLSSEKSVAAIARELGVNEQTLHSWRRTYRARADRQIADTAGGSTRQTLVEENAALRRELKRITEERDILKKAVGYFANPSAK